MRNKLLLIFLIIALNSCSNNKRSNQIECDLASKKDFMSDVESIELIPLENKEVCYLGSGSRLIKTEKDYYILDSGNSKKVLRFDEAGKLLNTIGNIGKGPNEYTKINSFQFIEDSLYCLVDKNKIFKYTKEGKLVGKNKIGFLVDEFIKFDDYYFFYTGYGNLSHKSRLLVADNNLQIKDKLLNHNSKMFHLEDVYIFSKDKTNLYIKEAFSSKILRYERDSLRPYRDFNFGSYSVKDSFFESKDFIKAFQKMLSKGFCLTNKYFKSGKYELVNIFKQKDMNTDKILGFNNGTVWTWYNSKPNDILNLISDSIHYLDNKSIVGVIDAVDCLDLKEIFGKKVNTDIYNKLEEDSNSLIIKIHMK